MTPQEKLDQLFEAVWEPTDQIVTVGVIVQAVGLDAARLVIGTLQKESASDPLLSASLGALTTVGMSLSSIERQGMIDQLALAGDWPELLRASVKALGGVWRPRWQVEGYPAEPTLDGVIKRQMIEATRSQISAKATAINAWLDAIDPDTLDPTAMRLYCDSLLASRDGNPPGGGE
jgi:hypothetical protein